MQSKRIVTALPCAALVLALAGLTTVHAKAQTSDGDYQEKRWAKPFFQQSSWDQKSWEEHSYDWHNVPMESKADMDAMTSPRSMTWHENWTRPYYKQNTWDQERWEENRPVKWIRLMPAEPDKTPVMAHSMKWHDEWTKPFFEQNAWDQERWEDSWHKSYVY